MCLQSDRFWPELCELIGRPELAADDRFTNSRQRVFANRSACIAELDRTFGSQTLAQWQQTLAGFLPGVWSAAVTFR